MIRSCLPGVSAISASCAQRHHTHDYGHDYGRHHDRGIDREGPSLGI